jgi:hypothetical protein
MGSKPIQQTHLELLVRRRPGYGVAGVGYQPELNVIGRSCGHNF